MSRSQTTNTGTPQHRNRTRGSWSRPRTNGPAAVAGRLLARLCGKRRDHRACWCLRCTLHVLDVYRREHVRYGHGAYVRTSIFGVRVLPDRYAFPLD